MTDLSCFLLSIVVLMLVSQVMLLRREARMNSEITQCTDLKLTTLCHLHQAAGALETIKREIRQKLLNPLVTDEVRTHILSQKAMLEERIQEIEKRITQSRQLAQIPLAQMKALEENLLYAVHEIEFAAKVSDIYDQAELPSEDIPANISTAT